MSHPTRRDLGAHLQAVRLDANLTHRQLSERIGLQPASIRRIERGTARTLATTLRRWLTACDVGDPDDWVDPYRHLLSDTRREDNIAADILSRTGEERRGRAAVEEAKRQLYAQVDADIAKLDRVRRRLGLPPSGHAERSIVRTYEAQRAHTRSGPERGTSEPPLRARASARAHSGPDHRPDETPLRARTRSGPGWASWQ